MREHYALGKSSGAAGVGKRGHGLVRRLSRGGQDGGGRAEQVGEVFRSRGGLAGAENAAKVREAAEIDVAEGGGVSDEESGAGVFQLIAHFALAVAVIQERGDGARECCGVVGGGEFPGVGQEDGDDFCRLEASADEAVGEPLDDLSVFSVREAAIDRSVKQRQLLREFSTRVEDDVMEVEVGGIGVELGTEHGPQRL